jgi:uncharacterized membrane protein (UPF0127 family)
MSIINTDCPKKTFRRLVTAFSTIALLLPGIAISAEAITLQIDNEGYRIELAETPEQRRLGLMHRHRLGPRQGMLLVYRQPGDHRIWMKNVLIPLRVYWIDAGFNVIDMQRLEPCGEDPCPAFAVEGDSQYVLELGDYEHPLAPGDHIDGLRDLY